MLRLVREISGNSLRPRIRDVLAKEEIGRVGPIHLCRLSEQRLIKIELELEFYLNEPI